VAELSSVAGEPPEEVGSVVGEQSELASGTLAVVGEFTTPFWETGEAVNAAWLFTKLGVAWCVVAPRTAPPAPARVISATRRYGVIRMRCFLNAITRSPPSTSFGTNDRPDLDLVVGGSIVEIFSAIGTGRSQLRRSAVLASSAHTLPAEAKASSASHSPFILCMM
jgi:hypothetical protein